MERAVNSSQMLIAENEAPIAATRSDEALIAAVLAGDDAAFELVFERYRRLVAHLAGRFFYDRSAVEESFSKVLRKFISL